MARTPNIAKVKKTLKDTASVTQETVGQVVGKARDTVEAVSPVKLPKRGSSTRKRAQAPAPERLEPQEAPRKTHGDALATGAGSPPPVATTKTAAKKSTKKTPAKKSPTKKSTAKKTPAKKSTAKKTPAKKSTAKKSAAKKSTAKKSTTKKSTTKKASAKNSPAKKAAAKK